MTTLTYVPDPFVQIPSRSDEAVFSCLNCTFSRNNAAYGSAVFAYSTAGTGNPVIDLTGSKFQGVHRAGAAPCWITKGAPRHSGTLAMGASAQNARAAGVDCDPAAARRANPLAR